MTAPAVEVPRGKPSVGGAAAPATTPALEQLAVDKIDVGENVRIQPGELEDLVASIKEHGVLQPVRAIGPGKNGRYRLVWGQRRLLASREAGLVTIPAIVEASADVDAPGAKRSIEQLVENLQRADLNPIDEAKALRQVLDADPELTQEQLAQRLGRSAPWVSNALRLLEVTKPVQQLIAEGKLTSSHGKALAALPEPEQASVAKAAVKDGLSAHEIEREAARIKRQREWTADQAAATKKRVAAAVKSVETKVEDKATRILVTGYDVAGNVAEALRKVGYANVKAESYGYYGATPPPSICDCTAVKVSVDYGDAKVTRHCVQEAHRKEVSKRELAKQQAAGQAQERHRNAAKAMVAGALEASPLSIDFARLLYWRLQNNWERERWAKTILKDEKRPDPWKAVCSLSLEQLTEFIQEHVVGYDVPAIESQESAS